MKTGFIFKFIIISILFYETNIVINKLLTTYIAFYKLVSLVHKKFTKMYSPYICNQYV